MKCGFPDLAFNSVMYNSPCVSTPPAYFHFTMHVRERLTFPSHFYENLALPLQSIVLFDIFNVFCKYFALKSPKSLKEIEDSRINDENCVAYLS